ncbi:hypothetical protein LSAT2_017871, partial [Lamellibrachia satsuma]
FHWNHPLVPSTNLPRYHWNSRPAPQSTNLNRRLAPSTNLNCQPVLSNRAWSSTNPKSRRRWRKPILLLCPKLWSKPRRQRPPSRNLLPTNRPTKPSRPLQ